jgi:hypothetical protein
MKEPDDLTQFSRDVITYAGIYLMLFIPPDKRAAATDDDIEAATRVAFIAARTSVSLARGLEESARAGAKKA